MKKLNIIKELSNWIFKVEKVVAMILCTVMLSSLSAGVVFRYVLKSPLVWSDEVAILCLVWITFIGGSMGVKLNNLAAITFLIERLNDKPRKIFTLLGIIITLLFVGTIVYISFGWLSSPNIALQKTASIGMPMIYGYLSIPVSFSFMLVHLVDLIFSNLKSKGGAET
ncbi:TRAP transporter small permease [Caldibacillus kokeshiiformis]|nr:TRAP transporter small permease [Pallidibacillus thermolactis]MCU9600976.1 TRAP transporter small permease [Pallidibacillus thermolactis subsp. kokeshiiformis]